MKKWFKKYWWIPLAFFVAIDLVLIGIKIGRVEAEKYTVSVETPVAVPVNTATPHVTPTPTPEPAPSPTLVQTPSHTTTPTLEPTQKPVDNPASSDNAFWDFFNAKNSQLSASLQTYFESMHGIENRGILRDEAWLNNTVNCANSLKSICQDIVNYNGSVPSAYVDKFNDYKRACQYTIDSINLYISGVNSRDYDAILESYDVIQEGAGLFNSMFN